MKHDKINGIINLKNFQEILSQIIRIMISEVVNAIFKCK